MPDGPQLSRFEEAALKLGRWTNETPAIKRFQETFVQSLTRPWVRNAVNRRLYVDGIDWLVAHSPDRGMLLAANHRSFFDQYIASLCLAESGVAWAKNRYFPVRSNFFYEKPAGVLINLLIGGGAMYPPIFRDRSKAELNRDAVERLVGFLQDPETLVGMHPEGQRGKGPDPYELLRAQPGVGEVILKAQPMVVPLFIGGLGNDFLNEARLNYREDVRRTDPVILCFGEPLDYSAFLEQPPRMTVYKRCADHVLEAIRALGERERELRAKCLSGEIGNDDPNWLTRRIRRRRGREARRQAPVGAH
ncbi:MAG: 1-acyl-sn-glycerol-3-phosphate acyltransferase [Planctomycetes bacterium]|nr:1-acyl-sn-glycerol-3-phosphate acyltransferase [Planctomycetota bacterium]